MLVGAAVLFAYYQPLLPTLPTWIPAIAVGWLVLAIRCDLVGAKIARWLRRRNWVEVHHVNAVEDTTEKYYVPPELWREKEIDGPDPYPSTVAARGPSANTNTSKTSASSASRASGSKVAKTPS